MPRQWTLALAAFFLCAAATANGYVLLDPPVRIGDPDLPHTYHIHYDIDELSIEGDHEFDLVRNAYYDWQHQVPNVDFIAIEGDPAAQCGIVPNGLDQISFQDCQDIRGPGLYPSSISMPFSSSN